MGWWKGTLIHFTIGFCLDAYQKMYGIFIHNLIVTHSCFEKNYLNFIPIKWANPNYSIFSVPSIVRVFCLFFSSSNNWTFHWKFIAFLFVCEFIFIIFFYSDLGHRSNDTVSAGRRTRLTWCIYYKTSERCIRSTCYFHTMDDWLDIRRGSNEIGT